ncbi:uncharacterized protein AKAME5_002720600 [Lates japonicus]|uniref:Uncharacterized protein n=1 Tax=Lates japonicus TaxID=270547 RepID=A0AAD3QWQ1_LATJO|nr:uncharacterized protein AKAME5_002720600 [Lates japonicus]
MWPVKGARKSNMEEFLMAGKSNSGRVGRRRRGVISAVHLRCVCAAAVWTGCFCRPICHLVVLIPYLIATLRMVSVLNSMEKAGRPPPVSMEMAPHADEAQGLDEDYDDITADVTTVYDQ